MANTTTIEYKNEVYNRETEYSQEDIAKIIRWEEEEQQRRLADTLGEQQRRQIANKVSSDIVSSSLRPNWFRQGTSYVFNLLRVAREAGNKALRSSQIQQISARLQIAGQRGIASAQDLQATVSNKAQHTAQDAKLKFQETTQDAKLKLQETAQDAKLKFQETTQDVKSKIQEKIGSAQGVAQQGIEKVQEVAKKLKSASLKVFNRVGQAFHNLSENTNLAFAVLEEESERAWRLNSDIEVFAITNALRVSSLLKDTAPALYRPAFEPTRKYSTRLLEENERHRRAAEALGDRTAIDNAKAISRLIEDKFRAVPIAPLPAKAEHVPEIKISTPYTAAM